MASYKAEFLSHHYLGRVRPRQAYSMGLVRRWARVAALAPRLTNLLTHAPALAAVAKFAAGMAPQRTVPRFARRHFRRWFRRREPGKLDGPRVILWADTFNTYFHPESAAAAVEVLEAAGYRVDIPREHLCCGRPLYDFGMLDLARRELRHVLDALEHDIVAGTPVIGLEPACFSVFRDELLKLFPDDPLARKLSRQTILFGDFLVNHANWHPPRLGGRALVHGHCHQQAMFGMAGDMELLGRLGVEADLLDTGCCGMAGAFGFDPAHYELSLKIGELGLLPAVRKAEAETMVVACGYSCREQIAQCTERDGLHLADIARLALSPTRAQDAN
jgi:Fe-S oxidoreductase